MSTLLVQVPVATNGPAWTSGETAITTTGLLTAIQRLLHRVVCLESRVNSMTTTPVPPDPARTVTAKAPNEERTRPVATAGL